VTKNNQNNERLASILFHLIVQKSKRVCTIMQGWIN